MAKDRFQEDVVAHVAWSSDMTLSDQQLDAAKTALINSIGQSGADYEIERRVSILGKHEGYCAVKKNG